MLSPFLRKNVHYYQGISRAIQDIEKVYVIDLISAQVQNTLSAGSLAVSTTMDPVTRLDNWASKWAAVFKQYMVLEIKAVSAIQSTSSGAPANGQIWARIEEENAVPTGSIVRAERAILNLHAPSDDKQAAVTCVWTPTSAEDLDFISSSSGFALAYHKLYANTTNTGTAASDSSSQVTTQFIYRIAFRYLA